MEVAKSVHGELLNLEPAEVEVNGQAAAGGVLHLGDEHNGQVQLGDHRLPICPHADQRRIIEELARRRLRQQRRQCRIAVQGERERRPRRFFSGEACALYIQAETIDLKPVLASNPDIAALHIIKLEKIPGAPPPNELSPSPGVKPSENGAISVWLVTS